MSLANVARAARPLKLVHIGWVSFSEPPAQVEAEIEKIVAHARAAWGDEPLLIKRHAVDATEVKVLIARQ